MNSLVVNSLETVIMNNPLPCSSKVVPFVSLSVQSSEELLKYDIIAAEKILEEAKKNEQEESKGCELKSPKPEVGPGGDAKPQTTGSFGSNILQKTAKSNIDSSIQKGHQSIDAYINFREKHQNKRCPEEDQFLESIEESFQRELSMMSGFKESKKISQLFSNEGRMPPVEVIPNWANNDTSVLDKEIRESFKQEFSCDIQCQINQAILKDLKNTTPDTDNLETVFNTVSYLSNLDQNTPHYQSTNEQNDNCN